ncbi:MAG: hypothetical protein M1334_00695 [Patescibacteria group bacterium]|nr:hypothetical protein [Patescibacteria group bacterium]
MKKITAEEAGQLVNEANKREEVLKEKIKGSSLLSREDREKLFLELNNDYYEMIRKSIYNSIKNAVKGIEIRTRSWCSVYPHLLNFFGSYFIASNDRPPQYMIDWVMFFGQTLAEELTKDGFKVELEFSNFAYRCYNDGENCSHAHDYSLEIVIKW